MRKTSLQFLDQQGKAHTLSLSIKDRKRLFKLMEKLFAEDSFAYTMLGSKPLSWANYHNPFPYVDWEEFRNAMTKYNRTLRLGWRTWEKYSHLFPTANFWVERPKCHPGSVSILLINEEKFNVVVNINKTDFQEVLGRDILDGYQLLKEAKDRSLMNEVLKGHQALMGIVLGYGRENSWEFQKGAEKRKPIGWVWENAEDSPFNEKMNPEISLTEFNLLVYSCPSFAGIANSEESLALKKEYLSIRQKVLDYYKDKDFLEATLSLLAGHRP